MAARSSKAHRKRRLTGTFFAFILGTAAVYSVNPCARCPGILCYRVRGRKDETCDMWAKRGLAASWVAAGDGRTARGDVGLQGNEGQQLTLAPRKG